jgi:branched-chain amino acid transport system substrate-binding protein
MLAGAAGLPFVGRARSQGKAPVIRIGSIQDGSGPYSHLGGAGSVACARLAIDEMAAQHGLNVELLVADHQNKPDIGASIARQWLDDGVDALLEFNNSAIALAVNNMVRERDKVMLANNVGSALLSGKQCSPNVTHWTFDTAELARVMGTALTAQGGDTWYFIRADYVFGNSLQDDTAAIVKAKGGKILGDSAMPLGTSDYASALLSAQVSGAKVIAFALARMKQIPIEDDVLNNARIRADGRVVSDVYLFEVKKPADSNSEFDLYELRATIGPDEAWRPMSEGGCPLVAG